MGLFKKKSKATMVTEVIFPTHTEKQLDEVVHIPEMTYTFAYVWKHGNHMKGTEEDEEYIIRKLNHYREEEIKDKIKQILFYYRKASGAQDTTYNLHQYVRFDD